MLVLTVYAVGRLFLAHHARRGQRPFPAYRGLAISIMGGIGMMSAGLIGSPGLGYAKDRFASEELQKVNPALYAEYRATTPSKFLFFEQVYGLDGKKLGEAKQKPADQRPRSRRVWFWPI